MNTTGLNPSNWTFALLPDNKTVQATDLPNNVDFYFPISRMIVQKNYAYDYTGATASDVNLFTIKGIANNFQYKINLNNVSVPAQGGNTFDQWLTKFARYLDGDTSVVF
jgi:hypothetical protein